MRAGRTRPPRITQPFVRKETKQLHTSRAAPLGRSLPLMRNLLLVLRLHLGLKLVPRVHRVRNLQFMHKLLLVSRPHLGPKLVPRVRRARNLQFMRNLLRVPRPHPGPKLVPRVRRVLHRKKATPARGEPQDSELDSKWCGPLHGFAPSSFLGTQPSRDCLSTFRVLSRIDQQQTTESLITLVGRYLTAEKGVEHDWNHIDCDFDIGTCRSATDLAA
jgi:hypothetical protein